MMAGCYDKRRFIDLEERPGTFKKHDFVTGKDEIGVDPEDVEEELEFLLEELKNTRKITLTGEWSCWPELTSMRNLNAFIRLQMATGEWVDCF